MSNNRLPNFNAELSFNFSRTETIQIADRFSIFKHQEPELYAMTEEQLAMAIRQKLAYRTPETKDGNIISFHMTVDDSMNGTMKSVRVEAVIAVHISGTHSLKI